MLPISDELTHALAEVLVLAAALGVKRVMDRWSRRRPKHAPMEQLHGQDIRINAALDAALYSTGASRAYVSLYRNGAMFDSGNPLMRKCRTHERVAPGVSGQAQNYRDMLVGIVPDEFTLVRADGHSFTAVRNLPAGNFRALCETEGTIAVARVALRKGGAVVGFVGADYGTAVEPANMAELEKAAGIVSLELAATAEKP